MFIHKVDSFSDDQRIECQREIQNHLTEELAAARLQQACAREKTGHRRSKPIEQDVKWT